MLCAAADTAPPPRSKSEATVVLARHTVGITTGQRNPLMGRQGFLQLIAAKVAVLGNVAVVMIVHAQNRAAVITAQPHRVDAVPWLAGFHG